MTSNPFCTSASNRVYKQAHLAALLALTFFCGCHSSQAHPAPEALNTPSLRPAQFLRFTVPLSTFVGSDPHTGDAIAIDALHGRILVELQVPTPPGAQKHWPGYINASIPLP